MTEDDLRELEELANRATPGPWEARQNPRSASLWHVTAIGNFAASIDGLLCRRDAEFIATARDAMPELIAEVRRLRRQLRNVYGVMSEAGISDE